MPNFLCAAALSRAPSAGSSLFHARAVPLLSASDAFINSTRVPILLLAVSVSPKASLVAARRPVAVKTVRASSSSSSADGALGTYTISRLARW